MGLFAKSAVNEHPYSSPNSFISDDKGWIINVAIPREDVEKYSSFTVRYRNE